jgi:hypothetical protein
MDSVALQAEVSVSGLWKGFWRALRIRVSDALNIYGDAQECSYFCVPQYRTRYHAGGRDFACTISFASDSLRSEETKI